MGNKLAKGVNDLETWCKQNNREVLLDEWDYEKNTLVPTEITMGSNKKIWWKCSKCEFEWQAVVNNRINGRGCPKCAKETHTSFPEQAIYFYIKQIFPDAINTDNHVGIELDIYIPSKKIAIEYDGEHFHNSSKKTEIDNKKNKLCKDKDITLIRVREPKLDDIDGCIVFKRINSTRYNDLNDVISNIFKYLGIENYDIDINRDTSKILEQYVTKKTNNSLAVCYPEIAKEWHPTKNGNLTPDKVNKSSHKKVWWMCKYGHEWQTKVNGRTSNGIGCLYCAGYFPIKGKTDLATTNPELLKDWNYKKNIIIPDKVSFSSHQKVWWKCHICGYEWQTTINQRTNMKSGCPNCYKKNCGTPIVCIETGIVYNNAREATRSLGLKNNASSRICRCCKGKANIVGGYHWKYADEQNII